MAGLLIVMALLAGACAFVVGHAFTVSRDSFLRTAVGGMVLAACVIFVLLALSLPDVVWPPDSGAWPAGLGSDTYRIACAAVAVAGLLVGISSGANVWACIQVASKFGPDKVIATVLPDRAERYFSTSLMYGLASHRTS